MNLLVRTLEDGTNWDAPSRSNFASRPHRWILNDSIYIFIYLSSIHLCNVDNGLWKRMTTHAWCTLIKQTDITMDGPSCDYRGRKEEKMYDTNKNLGSTFGPFEVLGDCWLDSNLLTSLTIHYFLFFNSLPLSWIHLDNIWRRPPLTGHNAFIKSYMLKNACARICFNTVIEDTKITWVCKLMPNFCLTGCYHSDSTTITREWIS